MSGSRRRSESKRAESSRSQEGDARQWECSFRQQHCLQGGRALSPPALAAQPRLVAARKRSSPRWPPNTELLLLHHVSNAMAGWLLGLGCARPPCASSQRRCRAPLLPCHSLSLPHNWAVPEGQDALCVLHDCCTCLSAGHSQHARRHIINFTLRSTTSLRAGRLAGPPRCRASPRRRPRRTRGTRWPATRQARSPWGSS